MKSDLINELQLLARYQYELKLEEFSNWAKDLLLKAINEISNLETLISEKEAALRNSEKEKEDLMLRLTMATKEREQFREKLVDFDLIRNVELLELRQEIENLTVRSNQILEEKKALNRIYNELKLSYDTVISENTSLKEMVDKLRKGKEDGDLTTILKEVEREEQQVLETKIKELEGEKNNLLEMLEGYKKSSDTFKEERDAFEIRVKELEEEKASVDSKLNELKAQLNSVIAEKTVLENKVSKLEGEITLYKGESDLFKTIPEETVKGGKSQEASTRKQMEIEIYEKAFLEMDMVFKRVSSNNTFPLEPLIEISRDMVIVLKEGSHLFEKVFSPRMDLISHSVNVGVIGIKIGLGLRYDEDELGLVGLGGFLHDLGMTGLPDGLITRPDRFLPEEVNLLKRHPEWSAEILGDLGETGKMIAGFIIQEHERLHGGGYPKGIKDVDEYAQVVGIADVYEALTHPRPYRRGLHPVDAIKEIVNAEKDSFLRKILKVVIEGLRIFPSGSYVKLNTGEIGVVVSTNDAYPLRPVLKIIYDDDGRKIEKERIIDLKENCLCWIASLYEMEAEKVER